MQTSLPNLVVFDLETTEFTPDRHEIIQIAAVRLATDGSIGDTFFTCVRPRNPVWQHVTVLATAMHRMVQHLLPVAPAKQLQAEAREYDFIATA